MNTETGADSPELANLLRFVIANPRAYPEFVKEMNDGDEDDLPEQYNRQMLEDMLRVVEQGGGDDEGLMSLAAKGQGTDTRLAHINPMEDQILRAYGGSGSANPETGMPQYGLKKKLKKAFKKVKKVVKKVAPIAAAVAVPFAAPTLAPMIAGATGLGLGASSALAGAGIGGLGSLLGGQSPVAGAAFGGLGGYFSAPTSSGMFGGEGADFLSGEAGTDTLGDGLIMGSEGSDVLGGLYGSPGLSGTDTLDDTSILAKLQDSKLLSEAAKYGVSGLIRYFGSQAALDKAQDVAKKLQQQTQFNPYNVTGPAGGATFSGNSVNTYLSPEMQGVANQYKGLSDQYASDISGFSTNDYVSKYLSWMRDISSEYDARNLEQLQSKALNTGMLTGPAGSRLFGEYYKRLNDADLQRQMTAETAGLNRLNTMNSLFNTSSGNYAKLLSSPYGYAELGGTLGGRASAANNAAAQYPWNVAEAQAAGTSGMWGNLASGIGNAVGQYLAPKNTNMSSYF